MNVDNTQSELSQEELAAARAQLVVDIDDAGAALYARFTRFSMEYELREKEALEFRAGGYTGTMPRQVAAFADRVSIGAQQATDHILMQAEGLRAAVADLGDLRMRKFEVELAPTEKIARDFHTDILNAISELGRSLGK